MKIQKLKFKQILKLYLLKYKVYEQVLKKNNYYFSIEINLLRVLSNFKKALQIIFRFHKLEKRILFIGVPKKLEFKINKLTNHIAISNNFDLQNINLKLFFPKLVNRQPDLIVLFSLDKKETIFSKNHFNKIPLIVFNGEQNLKNTWLNKSHYNIQVGNNNFILYKNIFFVSLNFLFKHAKKSSKYGKKTL